MKASFQGAIEAARNILLKSIYAVLLTLTAMTVVQIIGWIVGRCLRARWSRFADDGRLPRAFAVGGGGGGAPASLRADGSCSVQTIVRRRDVSDYDSEDNDVELARHATVTNVTAAYSGGRTGVVADFKYSETNV